MFSSFADNVEEMRRIIVDLTMFETSEDIKDITRQMREDWEDREDSIDHDCHLSPYDGCDCVKNF